MKPFIASLIAACGALTGCVAVPVAEPGVYISGTISASDRHVHRHERRHEAPRHREWRDRDGDGVPNHHDRRPRNPYRY